MGVGINIFGASQSQLQFPATSTSVWAKLNWSDDWTWYPGVLAMNAEQVAAPGIGQATLSNQYGYMIQEGPVAADYYYPVDLMGHFVAIQVHSWWGNWCAYIGRVEAEGAQPMGTVDYMSGNQVMTALGPEFWLDRIEIAGCRFNGHMLTRGRTFNRKTKFAHDAKSVDETTQNGKTIKVFGGNFSTAVGALGCREFHPTDKYVASNLDIIQYLIAVYINHDEWGNPRPVQFVLTGETASLDNIRDEYDFEGMSVWKALGHLIDRRRGLAMVVVPNIDPTVPIMLYVYSELDQAITVNGCEMPANPNQISVNFDGPDARLLEPSFRWTCDTQFDVIEVRGRPVKVCGTFSVIEGTLERAWTDSDEEALWAAKDKERSGDKFKHIFSLFCVPAAWNGKLGDGKRAKADPTKYTNAAVVCNDDGTILQSDNAGYIDPSDKVFHRDTPFPDYSDETSAEFLPAAGYVTVRETSKTVSDPGPPIVYAVTEKNNRFDISRLADATRHPGRLRPSDNEMAWWLEFPERACLAFNHFPNPAPKGTEMPVAPPEEDWETLAITAMFDTDEVLRARKIVGAWGNEMPRQKIIYLPDAESRCVLAGTVIGVTVNPDTGENVFDRTEAFEIKRDDSFKVQGVLAAAVAWHSVPRATIDVRISQVTPSYGPGVIFAGAAAGRNLYVGTPITMRAWDFQNNTTRVASGFAEIDFAAMKPKMLARPQAQRNPNTRGTADWYDWRQAHRPTEGTAEYYDRRQATNPAQATADWYNRGGYSNTDEPDTGRSSSWRGIHNPNSHRSSSWRGEK